MKMDLERLYESIQDYEDVIVVAGNDKAIKEFIEDNEILVKNINGLQYFEVKDKFVFLASDEESGEARIYLLKDPKPILNNSQEENTKEIGFEFKANPYNSPKVSNIAISLENKFKDIK